MMRLVRSGLVLAIVALVAALSSFATSTPALAHGGHAAPAAYAAKHQHHATKPHANDASIVKAHADELRGLTDRDDGKAGAAKCCGLSCMSAVPQHAEQIAAAEFHRSPAPPLLQPELLGRSPDRLDRPPTV